MKFVILVAALFCASSTQARKIELKDSDLEDADIAESVAEIAVNYVQIVEKNIPNWDAKATLEANCLTFVNSKLSQTKLPPGWDADDSLMDNVDKITAEYLGNVKAPGFNANNTVRANVKSIMHAQLEKVPDWLPKEAFENLTVTAVINALSKNTEINLDESVVANAVNFLNKSLKDAEVIDPKSDLKTNVDKIVDTVLGNIKCPGYSKDKTLDDDVYNCVKGLISHKTY